VSATRGMQCAAAAVAAAAVVAGASLGTTTDESKGSSLTHAAAAPVTSHEATVTRSRHAELPGGGRKIFPGRVLVAYYGTANTGSLGVLGEDSPDDITERLRRAARPFAGPHRKVQIVYELIASVAQASAGPDGDYSNYIAHADVRRYVRAAKRNDALLVLDLQPGRSDFLPQARHFRWALRKPWVGLALDPEWHMGPHGVPGQAIGHVSAGAVNEVSRFVARIVAKHQLPQKLFMVHQFRADMVRHIGRIKHREGLAMVQHVDGFGSRRQKLATYHAVAKPDAHPTVGTVRQLPVIGDLSRADRSSWARVACRWPRRLRDGDPDAETAAALA
jgi:hypothetical protein